MYSGPWIDGDSKPSSICQESIDLGLTIMPVRHHCDSGLRHPEVHLLCDLRVDLDPLGGVVVLVGFDETFGDEGHFDSRSQTRLVVRLVFWRAARPVERQGRLWCRQALCVYVEVGPIDHGGA